MNRPQPILISGAAGAIGGNLAKRLAKMGFVPILLDKDEKGLELLYDSILEESAIEPVMVVTDLTKFSANDAERLAHETAQELGNIAGFFHCACTWPLSSPSLSIPPNALAQAFMVQIQSGWLLFQVFAAQLLQTRGRTIFSTWQLDENPAYLAAINVTDKALTALITSFKDEHEDHSAFISLIDPGPFKSPLYRTLFPGKTIDELPEVDSVIDIYIKEFEKPFSD